MTPASVADQAAALAHVPWPAASAVVVLGMVLSFCLRRQKERNRHEEARLQHLERSALIRIMRRRERNRHLEVSAPIPIDDGEDDQALDPDPRFRAG